MSTIAVLLIAIGVTDLLRPLTAGRWLPTATASALVVIGAVLCGLWHPGDLLVVGIDANCQSHARMRKTIELALAPEFRDIAAIACPDPHIEKWYLCDTQAFYKAVGIVPRFQRKKCVRDYYKSVLSAAVRQAGHITTLHGIEFAADIVRAMDLRASSRGDDSLQTFIADYRRLLQRLLS